MSPQHQSHNLAAVAAAITTKKLKVPESVPKAMMKKMTTVKLEEVMNPTMIF